MKINEIRIKLGSVDSGPANAFLQEFIENSEENPISNKNRIFHDTLISLSVFRNSIHIEDIRSLNQGKGITSAAVKHLCALADKHKVNMDLTAKDYQYGHNTERLVKWYQKFGFEIEDEDYHLEDGVDMKRWFK